MIRSSTLGVALLAAAVLPLAAQAPRITSSGDPSIRSDSIYHLAVDPSAYPEEDYLYLLDDGVVRLEADGRASRTYRQVVQILTDAAIEQFSERSYGWSPDREKFHLNWIRVVRPDGTVISDGPAQSQESDVPVSSVDPVYSARKRLRITLSGVARGTIVDYSFTTEDTRTWIPGDFSTSWSIHNVVPTRRSRYILDAPVDMKLHVIERNLTFQPVRETRRGRQVTTWATREIPVIKSQSFSADSAPRYMSLGVSGPVTWEGIGAWYAGLARDRYVVTPAVQAAMQRVVAGATSRQDSIRALHKWVAQDIRYVSISLGLGGYQPRTPDEVVAKGFGDCKDKATLFVAALKAWGIPATTVLLSSVGGIDSSVHSLTQFDHAIARVDLPAGPVYTDLTAGTVPFGELPISYQGSFGLAVHPDGVVERVRFPTAPIAANTYSTEMHGVIDSTGRITGDMVVRTEGSRASQMRGNYQAPIDSTTRATMARRISQNMFEGARGDSLRTFDGKDLAAPAVVHLWFSGGKALQRSGQGWILSNPLGTMGSQEQTVEELQKEIDRDTVRWAPIDIEAATGDATIDVAVRFTLPPGWKVDIPPTVRFDGIFGTYLAEYGQVGQVFTAHRRMTGAKGRLEATRVTELIAYLHTLATDNTPYLSITTGGH